MANINETFTGTTGTVPSGWTATPSGSATIQSNAFRIISPATAYSTRRASRAGLANGDLLVDITLSTIAEHYPEVIVRSASPTTYNSGYSVVLLPDVGQVSLRRYSTGGVSTTLGTDTSLTFVSGSTYRLRFRFSGSSISYKLWLASGTEPAAWAATVTDATFSAAGTIHLLANAGGAATARTVTYDNLIVTDLALLPTPGAVLSDGSAATNHFDLQLARTGDAAVLIKTMAEIAAGYSEAPYFYTTNDGARVHLEARLDAPTTAGSAYSRCELREVNADGTNAQWDPRTGEHIMQGTTVITSLPPVKPEVVVAQVFGEDASADIMSIRTQLVSTIRLRVRIDGTSVTSPQIASPYAVGTAFNWKIRLSAGVREVYWSFGTDPLPGTPQITAAATTETAAYFKTGLYNQSNVAAGDAGTAIGAAELSGLSVTHAAPSFTTHNGAATLTGGGDLIAAAAPGRPGAVTLAGSGSLTASAVQGWQASATLAATAGLTAGAAQGQNAGVTLTGSGSLTATASRTQPTSATLAAGGALSAVASLDRPAAATLTGQGALAAAAGQTGAAVLSGTAGLTASVQQTVAATASLPGTAALSATASRGQSIGAALTGGGDLTAGAAGLRPASVLLAGTGSLSAQVVRVRPAAATLAAQGDLTADARLAQTAQATLAGSGNLTAGGTPVRGAGAVLAGGGALAAAAVATFQAAATLAGGGTLTTSGGRVQPAGAVLAAAATVSATGTRVRPVVATLTGGGTLTTSGTRLAAAAVALAANGQLIASATAAAGGVLNSSLWAVHPTSGVLMPLPHHVKLAVTPVVNAVGQITVEYPAFGRNADVLRVLVDDDRDLEVEIWLGGKRANVLRGILTDADGDDVAEGATNTYTGTFLELLLDEVLIWPQDADEKKELVFAGKNAGEQAATVLGQVQARGGLAGVTRDFTTTLDSSGFPWPTTVNIKYSPTATFLEMLQELVDLGLIDAFELTAARVLRLWAPGRYGVDRTVGPTPVTFRRGRNLTESPRRYSARNAGTTALVAGSEGVYQSASDATALARRGRRIEVAGSANNLSDVAAVQSYTQNYLASVTSGTLEVTHGLTFGPGHPRPLANFSRGDWVWSDTRGQLERLRVYQWTLQVEVGQPSGELVLNTPKVDALLAIARKLKRISSGAEVVGTSQPPNTEDKLAPAAPAGVTVDSQAYKDGSDTYATVFVGWTAVTTNSDNSAADDVAGYRVEWRTAAAGGNGWQLGKDQSGGSSASTAFGGAPAGTSILVRVAAYDTNGNTSAWSAQVAATTNNDTSAPPVPSAPVVTPYLGQLRVAWNGLGAAGEVMPTDLDFVELHVSPAAAFTPTAATVKDFFSAIAGERVVTDLDYGVTQYVRLVAVDRTTPTPNRSGPSAVGSATPSKVVGDDVLDGAIGSLKLADLAVKSAKIDLLAVNDAQFGSGSFGKLLAGTITVAVTNAGIIRSATSGQRYELDAAAFRLYNSAGTQTVQLNGSLNFIVGEIRTAMTAERIVLNPGGTAPNEIRFYPMGTSQYGRIKVLTSSSTTYNGQAGIAMKGYSPRSDQASGEVSVFPDYASIGFADEMDGGTIYSRISAEKHQAGMSAARLQFSSQSGSGEPEDSVIRFGILNNAGTAYIANSVMNMMAKPSSGYGRLMGQTTNIGLQFDTNQMSIIDAGGSLATIAASTYAGSSSRRVKKDFAPLDFDPVAAVQQARPEMWRYAHEAEDAAMRVGPMAEDLPAVLLRVLGEEQILSLDYGSAIGTVWAVAGLLADRLDRLEAQ